MNFNQIFNFLVHLEANNNRNWFNEHKSDYNQARASFEAFVNTLIVPLSQLDPSIGTITASECMFRIYRDIRFSNDKTPYKTHFSAFIANGGRKTRMAGYYVHLQPDESFIAGGIYAPTLPCWNLYGTRSINIRKRYAGFWTTNGFVNFSPPSRTRKSSKTRPKGIRRISRRLSC